MEARGGYEAEMLCRRVHVCVPRVLTSGGQSAGYSVVGEGVTTLLGVAVEVDVGSFFFVNAIQSAKEVHERHLVFLSVVTPLGG